MYSLYLNYKINQSKEQYILILSKNYPKDKDKFKLWRIGQLRAVYLNFLRRRDNVQANKSI